MPKYYSGLRDILSDPTRPHYYIKVISINIQYTYVVGKYKIYLYEL